MEKYPTESQDSRRVVVLLMMMMMMMNFDRETPKLEIAAEILEWACAGNVEVVG